MAELQDYSPTAGSNNSASPAGWPENMAPSGLNNADRELAARIARERDDTQGVTASAGTANALTLAAIRGTTAAYVGEMFTFRAGTTNTGATTMNVTPAGGSARGTVAIQYNGAALVGGEIVTGGVYIIVWDGTQYQLANATGVLSGNEHRNLINGLILSNDAGDTAHDVAIAVGFARDDTNAVGMDNTAILTKQIDAAWAVGDDAGGMDTGSVGANADNAVWLIKRSDTGVVDALFSLSFTAPTMPANYTHKRLIGMVHTDGSNNVTAFTQVGDYFRYTGDVIADVNDSTITSNTPEVGTISVPPWCLGHVYVDFTNPTQTVTRTSFSLRANGAADLPTAGSREGIYIQNDTSGSAMDQMTMAATVLVDGSSQVQYAAEEADGVTTCRINTFGFTMLTRSNPL